MEEDTNLNTEPGTGTTNNNGPTPPKQDADTKKVIHSALSYIILGLIIVIILGISGYFVVGNSIRGGEGVDENGDTSGDLPGSDITSVPEGWHNEQVFSYGFEFWYPKDILKTRKVIIGDYFKIGTNLALGLRYIHTVKLTECIDDGLMEFCPEEFRELEDMALGVYIFKDSPENIRAKLDTAGRFTEDTSFLGLSNFMVMEQIEESGTTYYFLPLTLQTGDIVTLAIEHTTLNDRFTPLPEGFITNQSEIFDDIYKTFNFIY